MPQPDDLLLPTGARLVHIGPHKTGTTALQGAFHYARNRLAVRHGVRYAGRDRQPGRAAMAVTGQSTLIGEKKPRLRDWEDLVAEVTAAGSDRVVVSSEFLCEADAAAAGRVVAELGGDAAHVVITLRPLWRILPSQWQQMVQNGLRTPFETWLRTMLDNPEGSKAAARFWRRHHHGQLVARWAHAADPQRLTVIVVDDGEPLQLPRTLEAMLGLPDGLLTPEPEQANRSLTLIEAEILRHINQEFRTLGWPDRIYAKHIRRGAITRMKTARRPAADEPRFTTPRWAIDRAAALGAEFTDMITSLGVRVVGDLGLLARPPGDEAVKPPPDSAAVAAAAASAAHAVIGVIAATGDHDPDNQPAKDQRVRHAGTGALLGLLARRATRRVAKRLRPRRK